MLNLQHSLAVDGVGGTTLVRAARLGAHHGVARLYLKLEGENPTQTHKDRAAAALVAHAMAVGSPAIVAASCGNFGLALAWSSRASNLACEIFVPIGAEEDRVSAMQLEGANVHRVAGTYEDALEAARMRATCAGLYDANPVGAAAELAMNAYAAIAREIHASLGGHPDVVWVPVGNGTAAVGIHRGFLALDGNPRIGFVGSHGNTALVASIAAGHDVELDPMALRVTPTNVPLVNWRSTQSTLAMEAVRRSGGCAYGATDAELRQCTAELKALEGIVTQPSGVAGLAGLLSIHADDAQRAAIHVVVLTSGCRARGT